MFKKIIFTSPLLSLVIFLGLVILPQITNAQNVGSLRTVVTTGFAFTMDLQYGYTDQDVLELQRVLNADIDTNVALDGDGSRGRETKYFGSLTKAAVIKFQNKYKDVILYPAGKTAGDGIVDKLTRTRLNLLIGVIDTYNSVGTPESTGVTTYVPPATTYVPPPSTTTITGASLSTCQFIELMITIGVVTPTNAVAARSIMGCPAVSGGTSFVDVKVNGQDGIVSLSSSRDVTVSWTSGNVTSCSSPGGAKPLSGSESYYIDTSGTFALSCIGPTGTVTDSVAISLTSSDDDEEDGDEDTTADTTTLGVSCQASPININTGGLVTWSASASGGSTYSYSWTSISGESLSGSGQSVSMIYPSAGTKVVQVQVTAGTKTGAATCAATVNTVVANIYTTEASTTNKVLLLSGGASDMVSIKQSVSLNLNQKMTIEAWVNPSAWHEMNTGVNTVGTTLTSSSAKSVIVSKGNIDGNLEYALSVDNGHLVFSNNNSQIWTVDSVIELDTWSHVAVTTDDSAGAVSLYVNGIKITDTTEGKMRPTGSVMFSKNNAITQATSSTAMGNIYIGNFHNNFCDNQTENGFSGKIDDLRIWNIARTATDIGTSTTKSVKDSIGLVGYWTFDNSSASDITINVNNGFMKGGVSSESDTTSPAAIVSGSSYTTYAFDPDFMCQMKFPEIASTTPLLPLEAAADFVQFGGVVTSVEECDPINSSDNKLWKVTIAPCKAGDITSSGVTGVSASPGYLVFRDGNPDEPSVGETVLGQAVHDGGAECTNAGGSDGSYIGVVSGPAGIGNDCGSAIIAPDGSTIAAGPNYNPLRDIDAWEYVVLPVAVTHAAANIVGSVADMFGF